MHDHLAVARSLVFEFTEFGTVQDMVWIERFVADMRKSGAQFAVDNFVFTIRPLNTCND